MFNWLKNSDTANEDRLKKIVLTCATLEGSLKAVQNDWIVGNKREGDLLLDALFKACIANYFEAPKDCSDEIRSVQYSSIVRLFNFLQIHDESKKLDILTKTIISHGKEFRPDQISQLTFMVELYLETVKSIKGDSDIRLIFYVCQKCGKLNLVSTAPCVHCSFAATTEQTFRRALLLSSNVMQATALLTTGRDLRIKLNSDPGSSIVDVWPSNNIDQIALQKTSADDSHIEQLLQKSINGTRTFLGVFKKSINCSSCGNTNIITADTYDQKCLKCKSKLSVPFFRKFKTVLSESLHFIACYADHKDDINYNNFIGTMVLINDYALRRDKHPSKAQILNLIQRFNNVSPLSYFFGQLQISISGDIIAAKRLTKDEIHEMILTEFEIHVSSLKILFHLLQSEDIQN